MKPQLRVMVYAVLAMIGLLGGIYCLLVHLGSLDYDGALSGLDSLGFSRPLAVGVMLDALVVGIAFLIWLIPEARLLSMRRWWVYVVLFFSTPLAFVVPLFLMMRELRLRAAERSKQNSGDAVYANHQQRQ